MGFPLIAAIVASTAVQAYGQVKAGKAQQIQLEEQARQEKIAAETRELQRQQELSKALAASNARLAAGGAAIEGTPASIALESAKQIGISEGSFKMSDMLKEAQLKRQGKAAASAGKTAALGSLLGGAVQLASAGAFSPAATSARMKTGAKLSFKGPVSDLFV